jgi:hypothetical protein
LGHTCKEVTTPVIIISYENGKMRNFRHDSGSILAWFLLAITLNLLYFSSIPLDFQRTFRDHRGCSDIPSSITSPSIINQQQPQLNYQLALDQSYGFFQDISELHWKLLQQISQANLPHLDPDDPLKFTDTARRGTTPSWYQSNYEPDFSCQFERRVGGNGNGDGPKWVCDPHRIVDFHNGQKERTKCLVYSIGSNGDFQFETALQQLLGPGVCEVHIFDMDDYSKEMMDWATRHNVTDLYFHKWGLASKSASATSASASTSSASTTNFTAGNTDTINHTFKSISDIVRELGHSERESIDIFKIDCESCEWDTFEEWLDTTSMPRLQQILVELHRSPPTKVLPFFNALRQNGYTTFHKEPNIQHSQGNCIEYGFLKLKQEFFSDIVMTG